MKICKMEGCYSKHYSRGYCRNHYRFFMRNGKEPTLENITFVNERRKAKKKKPMSKKKLQRIDLNKIKELKQDGRIDLIHFLIIFEITMEENKNKLITIINIGERRTIKKTIKEMKKDVEEIKQFIFKKEVSTEEVISFKEKLELKYVKEKNDTTKQMKL